MKLDELGARAGEALRREIRTVEVPEPRAVVRRWQRARVRTAALVAAAVVIAGVAVGVGIATSGSSGPSVSASHGSALPALPPIPRADVVPTFLWVDAADAAASGVLRGALVARLARVGQSMGDGRTCLPPQGLGGVGVQHALFEDPDVYRSQGAIGTSPGGSSSSGSSSATPIFPPCTAALKAVSTRLDASWRPLFGAWNRQVEALEATPAVAGALQGEIACMTARGYTVASNGYVTDGWVMQRSTSPQAAADVSAQIGRDFADCLGPLLAAREPVRRAARDTFVAQHARAVRDLQRSFDAYVHVVNTAKPVPLDPRIARRIAARVTQEARSLGERHPTHVAAVLATRRDATTLTGSIAGGDTYVYFVQFRGHFVCDNCSIPPGAQVPTGTVATLGLDAATLDGLDFGLSNQVLDLSRLGHVDHITLPGAKKK